MARLDRPRQADRLDHVLRGTARGLADGLIRGLGIRRQHTCRGAQLRCPLELLRDPIHGHDPRRPREHGAHHRREAHAAEADHDHGGASRDRGGLGHRADAGRDAAADECRDLRGDAVRHRDRRRGRHDDPLAERGDPAIGQDLLSIATAERRPAVRQAVAERGAVAAQPLPAAPALSHRRHGAYHVRATSRPTSGDRTPGPSASTMPAPSWPSTTGPCRSHSPSRTWRSEWQTPEASIRTRISPARGSSSSRSSIRSSSPDRSATAARTVSTTEVCRSTRHRVRDRRRRSRSCRTARGPAGGR